MRLDKFLKALFELLSGAQLPKKLPIKGEL